MSLRTARLLAPVLALLLGAPAALALRPDEPATAVGTVPREVSGARDIARLDGGIRIDRVILVLPRRDPDGLARLLADQHDPASPDFHRWLSPADFERRFGASDEDVAVLSDWLTGHGLEVEDAPPGAPRSSSRAARPTSRGPSTPSSTRCSTEGRRTSRTHGPQGCLPASREGLRACSRFTTSGDGGLS